MASLFDTFHRLLRRRQIHDAQRRAKVLLFRGLRSFFPVSTMSVREIGNLRCILVVRQHNQLGDMLCATPTLRLLRQAYPRADITLITSPANYPAVEHNIRLDRVLVFDKIGFAKQPRRYWHFLHTLRSLKPDVAIVLSTVSMSVTSDVLAYLSRARYRVGAAAIDGVPNTTGFLFNVPVTLDWRAEPHRHQALRNMDMLHPLGLRSTDLQAELFPTPEERARAAELLARIGSGVKVGIHPGAGKPANRWPVANFAELANALAQRCGAHIVITAGPDDGQVLEELVPALRAPHTVCLNRPLGELAAIIDGLDLMVSNDTGVLHVAGTTRVPLISLFGATDPEQWAPARPASYYLQRPRLSDISVEEVEALASRLLAEAKAARGYRRQQRRPKARTPMVG
ncbi:MAG: glycosyltransferase family 9 protein [bacterium]|jgi:heptosyltransferase-2|nr:glycosyltransferase family 9 protein [candidate division KSB1 bacterium]MDH7559675.1 glycosyltransferase family 9 protein [bacterium]